MFGRREQAKDMKKTLEAVRPKPKVPYAKPSFSINHHKNPFRIKHGRKEAGCRWWPEIGTGYVVKFTKTKRNDFLYRVAFPFLGAHRVKDGFDMKFTGIRGGSLLLPASELI
jgi:hypothetical protein